MGVAKIVGRCWGKNYLRAVRHLLLRTWSWTAVHRQPVHVYAALRFVGCEFYVRPVYFSIILLMACLEVCSINPSICRMLSKGSLRVNVLVQYQSNPTEANPCQCAAKHYQSSPGGTTDMP